MANKKRSRHLASKQLYTSLFYTVQSLKWLRVACSEDCSSQSGKQPPLLLLKMKDVEKDFSLYGSRKG